MGSNPCMACGACCSKFRVSFHWSEADKDQGGLVPAEMTEPVTPFLVCMKGTNSAHPHCVALQGKVGREVRCAIYAFRPSPCREFGVDWEDDRVISQPEDLARCNRVRAEIGLTPLVAGAEDCGAVPDEAKPETRRADLAGRSSAQTAPTP